MRIPALSSRPLPLSEMQAFATLADGTGVWRIKDCDSYSQDEYRYEAPVPLPEGTTIAMRYVYDNSAGNPRNPFDPPRGIRWGARSSDEMGDLLLTVLPRYPGGARGARRGFPPKRAAPGSRGLRKMLETDANNADVRHELTFVYWSSAERRTRSSSGNASFESDCSRLRPGALHSRRRARRRRAPERGVGCHFGAVELGCRRGLQPDLASTHKATLHV